MFSRYTLFVLPLVVAALAIGCGAPVNRLPDAEAGKPTETKTPASDHAHKAGAHEGQIVEIGRDNYHAEVVFEKDGVLKIHTLGKDESIVLEVESQVLKAHVKPEDGLEAVEVSLEPAPQDADGQGKTTRFVGTLPREMWGKQVTVTVPSISIAGQRFRFAFQSPAVSHTPMATGAKGEDERKKLYLTPGGLYTAADIKANGSVTARQKYANFDADHDMNPKPGDKICPVTETKSNPKCVWIVGGKSYEFCCPPCIDEFVKKAKEKPDSVKPPNEYTKQ